MSPKRMSALVIATLLAVPLGLVWTEVPASAAPYQPCNREFGLTDDGLETGSIDSDGIPDIVVGANANQSLVDFHLTDIGSQHVDRSHFVDSGGVLDNSFGAALATDDFNDDGCSDLAIGEPNTGTVYIAFGSTTGIVAAGLETLSSATSSDHFGASVAVAIRHQVGDATTTDLWVGAPNRTVGGKAGAGAVDHYVISPSGVASFLETVTAGSAPLGGTVSAGAHFGAVLSASANAVAIAAPDAIVNGQAGAGAVAILGTDDSTGHVASGTYWTQDSAGVPGAAEANDHFGASVFMSGRDGNVVAVGVPGEDLGSTVDAGSVQLFTAGVPGPSITQDTAGVPGTAEAGDQFGASVVMGVAMQCQEADAIAIGAPGEDVGTVADAGSVTLLRLPGSTEACAAKALTQGSGGLGGSIEAGDRVGATLTYLHGNDSDDEDTRETLVVGVPGEDVGAVKDAGIVTVYRPSGATSYGYTGGSVKGMQYGSRLTQPGGGPQFLPPFQ